jgi:7,8-dihydropterin-6-yl-methyl-4-(beta-D-ribofuranosyl)aminobenzene 5'-phosphate synthase
VLGLPIQKLVGSGDGPFSPLTMEEVADNIAELRDLNLAVVGLSGHDSDDAVIDCFREAFGAAYRDVRVGEPIDVAAK